MSIRKLAGQTAVYGMSSIVARLLNYMLTPYFTRYMSTGEYGVITDMYALIPFALVLLTMGLESGFFRFAGKASDEGERRRIFSSVWGAVCLASAIFLAVALLFMRDISSVMGYAAHPSYIGVVAGIIALDAVAAIPLANLRQQGRAMRYVSVRIWSVVINILLCLFFYSLLPLWSDGFPGAIYNPSYGAGYAFVANLAASGAALLMVIPSCRGVRPTLQKRVVRPILLYSLPLLVSGIAGTANEFIDRQMIKYLMPGDVSLEALGIYGAVTKIGVVLLMFTQMYRLGAEPYFLGNLRKEDFVRMNAEAMKYFIIVSMAIFLCIALFSDIFALIIGRDYREGMYILPVVLAANVLAGVVFNLSFWYKQGGHTWFAIVVTGTGLAFTVALNIFLVPRYGYYGAAWARLICEAAMVVVSYILNRKYCPTPYPLGRIAGYVILAALLFRIGMATGAMSAVWKYLCNLALLGIYTFYALWREKINLKSFFRR